MTLLFIAAFLLVLWAVGFIVFRVAKSFIHLLLVIGLVQNNREQRFINFGAADKFDKAEFYGPNHVCVD